MMFRVLFRLTLIMCLFFGLTGCGGAAPADETPTPSEALSWTDVGPVDLGSSASFEKAECMFQMPEGMPRGELKVECGYLTVPEDRSHPDGPKLRLAAAIYKTSAESPKPDPLLILIGGYGSFLQYSMFATYLFRQVYAERDLVVLEPRGTGFSEPDLSCAGLSQLYFDALSEDVDSQAIRDRAVELRRACRQDWEAKGVQLSAYTTAAGAQDLEDLRQALGYRQWNIFANGLDTRLAFELARKYPQGVRSLVLDTAMPPQVEYFAESATNAQRALKLLFQRCAEDSRCRETFPDLENVFYELVDQLNAAPVDVEVPNLNAGQRLEILLSGDRLIDTMLMSLNMGYDERVMPEIPRMLFQIRNGKMDVIKNILSYVLPNYAPNDTGKPDLVLCNEELLLTPEEKIREANDHTVAQLAAYYNRQVEAYREICEVLRFPQPLKGTKEPVTSSVPALFLSGEFTTNAPPAWAELASSSIRPSYLVEFARAGPFVSASPDYRGCSAQIINAYLDNPSTKPDLSCASEKRTFLWVTLP